MKIKKPTKFRLRTFDLDSLLDITLKIYDIALHVLQDKTYIKQRHR